MMEDCVYYLLSCADGRLSLVDSWHPEVGVLPEPVMFSRLRSNIRSGRCSVAVLAFLSSSNGRYYLERVAYPDGLTARTKQVKVVARDISWRAGESSSNLSRFCERLDKLFPGTGNCLQDFAVNFYEEMPDIAARHHRKFDYRDKYYAFVYGENGWFLPDYRGRASYFYCNPMGWIAGPLNRSGQFFNNLSHDSPMTAAVQVDADGNFSLLDFCMRLRGSGNRYVKECAAMHYHQGTCNVSTYDELYADVYRDLLKRRMSDGRSFIINELFDAGLEVEYAALSEDQSDVRLYAMNQAELRNTLFPVISVAFDEEDRQFPKERPCQENANA